MDAAAVFPQLTCSWRKASGHELAQTLLLSIVALSQ